MPAASLKPCRQPGCAALVSVSGYCSAHLKTQRKASDAIRDQSVRRLYNARWRKARLVYLAQHPFCTSQQCAGRAVAAQVVDHIEDHKGDEARFWDVGNWQPLCKSCHDSKTGRTAAFGRSGATLKKNERQGG
jgi:5-methylcytosine-specific restriction protein A